MTPAEIALARHQRFTSSMSALVHDERFSDYIDAIRQETDNALDGLTSAEVVGNQLATAAAIGEITAYRTMTKIFDEFKNRPPEEPEVTAEADLT